MFIAFRFFFQSTLWQIVYRILIHNGSLATAQLKVDGSRTCLFIRITLRLIVLHLLVTNGSPIKISQGIRRIQFDDFIEIANSFRKILHEHKIDGASEVVIRIIRFSLYFSRILIDGSKVHGNLFFGQGRLLVCQ